MDGKPQYFKSGRSGQDRVGFGQGPSILFVCLFNHFDKKVTVSVGYAEMQHDTIVSSIVFT